MRTGSVRLGQGLAQNVAAKKKKKKGIGERQRKEKEAGAVAWLKKNERKRTSHLVNQWDAARKWVARKDGVKPQDEA